MSATSKFLEDYVSLACPLCERPVRVIRIYAPSQPGLKQVGVRHDDHVVIIKFDKYGVARDINAYPLVESAVYPQKTTIKCTRCNETVPILYESGLREYAVEHQDHFVIVFLIGKTHVTQTIDKVEPLRVPPRPNIITKIRREIGLKNLAMIMYYCILGEKKRIRVPAIIKEELENFLRKTFDRVPIILQEGALMNLGWCDEADYFWRKLLYVIGFSDKEAIMILKETVEMIKNMVSSLKRLLTRKGEAFVCSQIVYLREKDAKLYELIQKLLHLSCTSVETRE
ncbi:MAG: hypothetical protein ACTSX9_09385 [Candidatus Njordarchaeales archaeon]